MPLTASDTLESPARTTMVLSTEQDQHSSSLSPQSTDVKNAVDPASLGRSTAVHSAGSSTGESMDNTGAGGGADKFQNSNAEAISRTMTDASMPKEEKERTMSVNADAAVENGLEWRDKVEDRSARQHIARIILTLIVKSANRPTAMNYNPREIARRLEHNLYMTALSKEEYGNVHTLKARLQQALDQSRRRQLLYQQQNPGYSSTQQINQQRTQVQARSFSFEGQERLHTPQKLPVSQYPQPISQTAPRYHQNVPFSSPAVSLSGPRSVSVDSSPMIKSERSAAYGNSILDELDREADEMANGTSDEPIAMPESEMQAINGSKSIFMSGLNAGSPSLTAVPELEAAHSMNSVPFTTAPMSIPTEISGPSNTTGNPTASISTNATTIGSTMYQGMNLTDAQMQQIQQLQQFQQLRRMQQLQQMQRQQHVTGSAMPQQSKISKPPASTEGVSTIPITSGSLLASKRVEESPNTATYTTNASVPPTLPLNQAAIAQKREELKRRLVQLKHARTCTNAECAVDYCGRVKVLLAHVSRCTEPACITIGCKSTRQLLSHFRKCRNMQCEVCSAIRPPMNEQEQRLVLRRQQERLCMLRHVSTCAEATCTLPYCASMKNLWKHICQCHQRQCRTDHCISSRYVLSHFKQCNKVVCEVCGPVRRAIKIVDLCKRNAAQLQTAIAQSPETIRSFIRIMNTVSFNANEGLNDLDEDAGARAAGATTSPDISMTASYAQMGVDTKEEKMTLSSEAVESSGEITAKRKPLRLQTEKEKKKRRKEQAKIAKARTLARAQANVPGTNGNRGTSFEAGVSELSTRLALARTGTTASSGLVVRGMPSALRTDQFVTQQDISFLDSMTAEQLDEHIRSLRFNFCGYISLTELKNRLMPLLSKLMESEHGWAFNSPVDPVQWNIPDYFDIIKCPMDLGAIKKRLENEHYNSVDAFAADVRLVFENCIAYNSSTNKFNIAAKQLLTQFEKTLTSLKSQLERQLCRRCEQRREEMCQLCGGDSFKFAPCMLFCSGPCRGRIRRHTHYYSDPRGEHHWCSTCYKQMKDGPIDLASLPQLASVTSSTKNLQEFANSFGSEKYNSSDQTLTKAVLVKRKNSEVAEEPWVECDSCKLWYHQICALFNERNHAISGEQEPFVCPICVKKQRTTGVKPSIDNGLKASRLPITRMAKLIEDRVNQAIKKANEEEATRMGNLGNRESIGCGAGVHGTELNSTTRLAITVREVLSVDKLVQVKTRMGALLSAHYCKPKSPNKQMDARQQSFGQKATKRKRAALQEGPNDQRSDSTDASALHLTYRSRCICVFQELDGVDVLIFTLYVQEYGPESLAPNAGRVYVSYLDSVNYFQPKKWRTLMHQQVMLGFLQDSKQRGFHTAHIWSCPPLKGDDYIFFCKPENQKIPKSARLRQWYHKLLQEAKKEKIVVNISNLYADYYLKKKEAHELPYFEGDYWPRLAEDLLKQLEDKSGRGEINIREELAHPSDSGLKADPSTLPTDEKQSRRTSPAAAKAQPERSVEGNNACTGKTNFMTKSKKKRGRKTKRSVHSPRITSPEPSISDSGSQPAQGTRSNTKKKSKKPKQSQLNRLSTSIKGKAIVNPDPLMQKLKVILEPQKDDFFVVDLYPKCHKCGTPNVNLPYWEVYTLPPTSTVIELIDAVKKARTSSSARNSPPRHYHHYYCLKCYEANKNQIQHRITQAECASIWAENLSTTVFESQDNANRIADVDLQEIKYRLLLRHIDPITDQARNPVLASPTADPTQLSQDTGQQKIKCEQDDSLKEISTTSDSEKPSENLVANLHQDLDDVLMPCEIFDTRESFLMYCQNNHCQFDQIRRAKHSSMMVLYHLFNQGTTGFTFTCSGCRSLLAHGNRWNCSVCPLFNLCDECNGKVRHQHPLHVFRVIAIPRLTIDEREVEIGTKEQASMKGLQLYAEVKRDSKLRSSHIEGIQKSTTYKEADRSISNQIKIESLTSPRTLQSEHLSKAENANKKRKVYQQSPLASPANPQGSGAFGSRESATISKVEATFRGKSSNMDSSKKLKRIHNVDPQLLVQLEHASSCAMAECTFVNCHRIQAMLKHGSVCELRATGSCVLCKRIVGLLSAHARQCLKEYDACQVPRCTDIRRHLHKQIKQRQWQSLKDADTLSQTHNTSEMIEEHSDTK
ncbi:unnamed protein product [Albugo candida]|nr:unnamed protein product [Albugo candida]|eukprot:CCI46368.1 unnamed protein product [Albugo candida]